MAKSAIVINPYRKVVEMPKPKTDWSVPLLWLAMGIFALVEGGSAIFGFKAFVMWAVSKLHEVIR